MLIFAITLPAHEQRKLMKNSLMIAVALVGTAALAQTLEKVIKNSESLSADTKARLLAALDEQCCQMLTRVQ